MAAIKNLYPHTLPKIAIGQYSQYHALFKKKKSTQNKKEKLFIFYWTIHKFKIIYIK